MKDEIYEIILTDSDLQAKLMIAFSKSYQTIRKWSKEKNPMLTSLIAQAVIDKHLKELGIDIEIVCTK